MALYNHSIRKKYLDAILWRTQETDGDPHTISHGHTRTELYSIIPTRSGSSIFREPDPDALLADLMMIVNEQTGEEVPDPYPK